jgi:fibronectin-binding autotransporter adhesin
MSKGFSSSRRRAKVRGLAAVALATGSLALVAQKSRAQYADFYWDPTMSSSQTAGGSGTWDLSTTNWYYNGSDTNWGNGLPQTSQLAYFQGTAGTVALVADVGAAGLAFTTPGYTISGTNTITLNSQGIDTSTLSSGVTTINPNLYLINGPQTWTNGAGSSVVVNGNIDNGGSALILNNAGTTTFNGAISDSGGLTVTNTGTTIITAASSYSGSTWAQAGTIQVGANTNSADNVLPIQYQVAPSVVVGMAATTNSSTLVFNANQTIGNLYVIGNNSLSTQTITIATGKTLTVGNGGGAIALGSAIANGDVTNVVFNGGGNLVINADGGNGFAATNLTVGEPGFASIAGSVTGDTDKSIVDMRGLTSFTGSLGTLHVGDNNTADPSGTNDVGSTLYLAPNVNLFTGRTDIESGAPGATDTLRLGNGATTLSIPNLFIGAGDINGSERSNGSFIFDSSSGTLSLSAGAIDMDSYGTYYGNAITTSGSPTSLFDVSGHQANITISVPTNGLSMAFRRGSTAGGATSTFNFGGTSVAAMLSTLNVPTIQMGERGGTTSGIESATINLEGGAVTNTTLVMGENNSTNNSGAVNATMNISGGNVTLSNVIMATTGFFFTGTNSAVVVAAGTANANLNVSGGTVSIGALSLGTGDSGSAVSNGTLNITGSGDVAMGGNIVRSGIGHENSTITVNGTSGALLDLGGYSIGSGSAAISTINVTAGTIQNVGQVYGGTVTIGTGTFAILNAVASNAVTNSVSTLNINGSGNFDLANSNLITSTPSNTIRQYLINGYNGGAWNGTGGITSVNANASYNIPASNGGHFTALGYTSGTSTVGAALGLTAGQTLVKYTIYGDANLDGTVDINDLNIVLSNFLSGNPATWDTGDFFYAGQTDISDLNAVLSNFFDTAPTTVRAANAAAKFKASTASTAKTLTGTVSPADTVSPPPANGVLELVVNTTSGDVELEGNNADIASLQITSASSSIITANWTDLHANGYTNWSDTAKKKTGIGEYDNQFTATGDYAVLGVVDYGDIYNTTVNAEDYVFKYGSVESNDTTVDTDTGSVIYVSGVPEPTTLSLLGLAAAGLMGRRRKSKQPR